MVNDDLDLRVCDALLLQFKEPIVPNHPNSVIPSGREVEQLVYIAGKVLSGEYINPLEISYLYCVHNVIVRPEQFSRLPERVKEGIPAAFYRMVHDEESVMEAYLSGLCAEGGEVIHEWIHLFGDFYRFSDAGKLEAQKRVREYFSKKELVGFEKIGQLFLPYIKRLHAATMCEAHK